MPSDVKPFWQQVLLGLGAVLVAPLFICLLLGRLVFFATLDACEAIQQVAVNLLERSRYLSGREAGLIPFWAAWLIAMLLLAGTFAGGIFVVARTETWAPTDQIIARSILTVLVLAGLYLAFRLALQGTAILQRVLGLNLARLIAAQLDELRAQAEERSRYLAMAQPTIDIIDVPSSPALPVPNFFRDADEIAKLLGEPTERALEDLLSSLMAFNRSLDVAGTERLTRGTAARQSALLQLRRQLFLVHERLTHAMQIVTPLCHPL